MAKHGWSLLDPVLSYGHLVLASSKLLTTGQVLVFQSAIGSMTRPTIVPGCVCFIPTPRTSLLVIGSPTASGPLRLVTLTGIRPLAVGDPITSSDVRGVGMKQT